jgi:hypothetical protein
MAGNVSVSLDRAHLAARFQRGKDHCGPILAQQIIDDCNQHTTPNESTDVGLAETARPELIEGDWCATWNTVYAAFHFYGCWPDGSHRINDANRSREVVANPSTQWTEKGREMFQKDWDTVAQREFVKGAE